jgi:hypothetical protein
VFQLQGERESESEIKRAKEAAVLVSVLSIATRAKHYKLDRNEVFELCKIYYSLKKTA